MNLFIILEDGISMLINMVPYTIDATHPKYEQIREACRDGDWEYAQELIDVAVAVQSFGGNKLEVNADAGTVNYNGEPLHGSIVARIIQMISEGFSVEPLVCFLDNLMQNPSKRAVDELYGFLEYGKMPITEDGCFLAYKRVRSDYKSVHDGVTDNSIGMIVQMPRNKVDDRSDNTCSYGLHFCSHEYLKSFSGERVVILKINPRDVVSIPTDYNNTKGRACRYEVIGELSPEQVEKALGQSIWSTAVVTDFDDRDVFDDDVEFDDNVNGYYDDDDHDDDDEPTAEEIRDRLENELVTPSYAAGYERGYGDGRHKRTKVGDPVIVTEYVEDYEAFINAYKRGHKDGKAHTKKAKFIVE